MTPDDLDRIRCAGPEHPYGGYDGEGEPAAVPYGAVLRVVAVVLAVLFIAWRMF